MNQITTQLLYNAIRHPLSIIIHIQYQDRGGCSRNGSREFLVLQLFDRVDSLRYHLEKAMLFCDYRGVPYYITVGPFFNPFSCEMKMVLENWRGVQLAYFGINLMKTLKDLDTTNLNGMKSIHKGSERRSSHKTNFEDGVDWSASFSWLGGSVIGLKLNSHSSISKKGKLASPFNVIQNLDYLDQFKNLRLLSCRFNGLESLKYQLLDQPSSKVIFDQILFLNLHFNYWIGNNEEDEEERKENGPDGSNREEIDILNEFLRKFVGLKVLKISVEEDVQKGFYFSLIYFQLKND